MHSGTLTQRSVHPASPVLLRFIQTAHARGRGAGCCPPLRLCALHDPRQALGCSPHPASRLSPGPVRSLSKRAAGRRPHTSLTHAFPHVTADSQLNCLASRLSSFPRQGREGRRRSLEPGRVAARTPAVWHCALLRRPRGLNSCNGTHKLWCSSQVKRVN